MNKSANNNNKLNKNNFKLNENVEFLETPVRNWRYGRIIEYNNLNRKYKIYSGTDIFWAKEVRVGERVQLESI
jgi:hypothetical protein